MPDTYPKTLIEAVRHFADPDACHDYMVRLKYPDGKITCPKCGGENVGKAANMHKSKREARITGRGAVGKSIVHGLLERGGLGMTSQVVASVVGSTDAARLLPEVRANVVPGSHVYTDAHASYRELIGQYWHRWIDHAAAYVAGRVHVNGLENFWSLLKRTIKGTYVAIAPFHLFRYVDEQAWRFNVRDYTDGERFVAVMKQVFGKRLTFRELCAIGDAGFMGIH